MVRENRRFFLWMTLAGLALRLYFFVYFPAVSDDSRVYLDLAKNWLQQGVYGQTQLGQIVPADTRLPGYPAFLAAMTAILPEGAVHQGLALLAEPLDELDIEDVLRQTAAMSGRSIVVLLDQVSDPQNIGAVLRSAAAFGALAVVLAEHGAPPVTGALAKAASGALDRIPLVRTVNLARTLDRLKQDGFWICGLDESADAVLSMLDLGDRIAIVLGGEGRGMRRLVRERCDYLARLPTRSAQRTLNISNAAAVALYELTRLQIG